MVINSHPKFQEFIKKNPLDQDVVRVALALNDYDFKGKKVLVVGCNEDPFANLFAELGADVTGLDLREYSNTELDTGWEKPLYKHIIGDAVTYNFEEKFDLCVSVSVVEHIGLGWIQYGGVIEEYGDSWAMKNMHSALKEDGIIIITVPIGGSFKVTPHWRRYTKETLNRLICEGKLIDSICFATSYLGAGNCDDKEVSEYHDSADISVLLKIGK